MAVAAIALSVVPASAARKIYTPRELNTHPELYDGKTVTVRGFFQESTDFHALIQDGPVPPAKFEYDTDCLNLSRISLLRKYGKSNRWVTLTGQYDASMFAPEGNEEIISFACQTYPGLIVKRIER